MNDKGIMEQWWVEYVEEELEGEAESDSDWLLSRSPDDWQIVNELICVKKMVKDSTKDNLPQSSSYYDKLEAKITQGIKDFELQSQQTTTRSKNCSSY